jgi:hypothetical protein
MSRKKSLTPYHFQESQYLLERLIIARRPKAEASIFIRFGGVYERLLRRFAPRNDELFRGLLAMANYSEGYSQ